MSFGQLSRWYSSLDDRALRNRIAQPLGLPETVLVPFLKHLSTVRNSCAHHGRLWNRGFLIRMRLPHKPADLAATLEQLPGAGPARIYNTLFRPPRAGSLIYADEWQALPAIHIPSPTESI